MSIVRDRSHQQQKSPHLNGFDLEGQFTFCLSLTSIRFTINLMQFKLYPKKMKETRVDRSLNRHVLPL
ncbi:hypothetical protein OUZ56_010813 [Daphnia magna]|uniref:Uncharacterized protein n=1 Tax=Daphnia magna TaxID=35525 RepID=A0ABQ9YYK9_9CRUS|nr:hypothetical protein OUZ56_010813 [Daphnia magna]